MKTILCYGDSNTYGYDPGTHRRYGKDLRWTGILAGKLGPEYTVIEEGCNGRTTVYADPGEPWVCGLDYLKPCLKSHKPVDVFVLMLGTNDLKTYLGLSAEEIAAGAGKLVQVAKEFCMQEQGFAPRIVLVSPPAVREEIRTSPFYPDFDETSALRSREFAGLYKKLADKEGCIFRDVAPDAEISLLDCIHLTAEGHRSIAETVFSAVAEALE